MTSKDRPTAVFDCMIFLQGLLHDSGPAAECVELFEQGAVDLVVTDSILHEIAAVLSRPSLRAKYSQLTEERSDRLVEYLTQTARVLDAGPIISYCRDPKDDKYIDAAIRSDTQYIVTRDNDLLSLMTAHTSEAKEFRQKYRGLKVIDPVEFLGIIKALALEP